MAGVLKTARELLRDVTPLRKDCGALCDAACCRDDEEEELGMLLFPGEELLYAQEDGAWMRIVPSEAEHDGNDVPLLVCGGTCPRDRRPLACRIFPLGPRVRAGKASARIDGRARAVCPLCDSGVKGLAPEFVAATEQAFAALWQDARQREYLIWLSGLIGEYDDMIKGFLQR